ncbi:hypothetical protein TWF281_010180 [Arthrobotrys megalospora]
MKYLATSILLIASIVSAVEPPTKPTTLATVINTPSLSLSSSITTKTTKTKKSTTTKTTKTKKTTTSKTTKTKKTATSKTTKTSKTTVSEATSTTESTSPVTSSTTTTTTTTTSVTIEIPSTTSSESVPPTATACAIPLWGRCGGIGHTGCTNCVGHLVFTSAKALLGNVLNFTSMIPSATQPKTFPDAGYLLARNAVALVTPVVQLASEELAWCLVR